jgi:hypothetical protein
LLWIRALSRGVGLKPSVEPPNVMCPGCRKPIRAEKIERLVITEKLVEITYVCDHVGTATKED